MDKKKKIEDKKEDEKFPLPVYDKEEDIYSKEKEEPFEEEENAGKSKKLKKKLGDDLDVPGAEIDDADEEVGDEDEENNYYSLGGDDHNDLEEDPEWLNWTTVLLNFLVNLGKSLFNAVAAPL